MYHDVAQAIKLCSEHHAYNPQIIQSLAHQADVELGSMCQEEPDLAGPMMSHLMSSGHGPRRGLKCMGLVTVPA